MKLKKELRAVKEINEQERKKRDDGEDNKGLDPVLTVSVSSLANKV